MKSGLKSQREHFAGTAGIAAHQRRSDRERETGGTPETESQIRRELEVGLAPHPVGTKEAPSASEERTMLRCRRQLQRFVY
jgi:hypothetical protein